MTAQSADVDRALLVLERRLWDLHRALEGVASAVAGARVASGHAAGRVAALVEERRGQE